MLPTDGHGLRLWLVLAMVVAIASGCGFGYRFVSFLSTVGQR